MRVVRGLAELAALSLVGSYASIGCIGIAQEDAVMWLRLAVLFALASFVTWRYLLRSPESLLFRNAVTRELGTLGIGLFVVAIVYLVQQIE